MFSARQTGIMGCGWSSCFIMEDSISPTTLSRSLHEPLATFAECENGIECPSPSVIQMPAHPSVSLSTSY